jgi:hypothetical protein
MEARSDSLVAGACRMGDEGFGGAGGGSLSALGLTTSGSEMDELVEALLENGELLRDVSLPLDTSSHGSFAGLALGTSFDATLVFLVFFCSSRCLPSKGCATVLNSKSFRLAASQGESKCR